jgi:hypothetical protein
MAKQARTQRPKSASRNTKKRGRLKEFIGWVATGHAAINSLLGILLLALNVAIARAAIFGVGAGIQRTKAEIEKEQLRITQREDQAGAPQLVVDYLGVNEGPFLQIHAPPGEADSTEDGSLRGMPILRTGVAVPYRGESADEEGPSLTHTTRTMLLRVQNRGVRRATSVQLVVRAVALGAPVTVQDRQGRDVRDFRDLVRESVPAAERRVIEIPDSDPARGILVPLFMASFPDDAAATTWQILPGTVLLPDSLIYMADGRSVRTRVRPMRDPVLLASGIEVRG